jgi:predicted permease
MLWARRIWSRVVGFARPNRVGREVEEELRMHVALRAEANERAGMSPREAWREAERSFGNYGKIAEQCRELRGGGVLDALRQDLVYATRVLRKAPGFTAVAVLTLALGVGANSAIFSIVDAVLLRPLPFPEADRLVLVGESTSQFRQSGFSVEGIFDVKARTQSFESFGGFYPEGVNLGGADGTTPVGATYVMSEFFDALGARPAIGRAFAPAEDKPGAERVVILSSELWRDRFGADPSVVGASVQLEGLPYTVVGVAPPGLRVYERVDLWLPMGLAPLMTGRGHHWNLFAVAKLKPGVTLAAAAAELDGIGRQLAQEYPDTNADRGLSVVPLQEDMVGESRTSLLLLLAAVGFVLLIACANVANLVMARGVQRRREIAIRAALGAGHGRIARQLLTESFLLALLGGVAGLLLAYWSLSLFSALGASAVPRVSEVGIDLRAFAFSLGVSAAVGVLLGLVPVAQLAKPELGTALRAASPGADGAGRLKLRGALIAVEMALALVLLIGAGLLVKSLATLRGADPGYDPDRVLAVTLSLPRGKYHDQLDKARFSRQVLERLDGLPGVERSAAGYPLPVYGNAWGMFYATEREAGLPMSELPEARTASVTPGFFPALRIPLLQGRDFTEADTEGAAPVVIVDEALARRHWPDGSAVGRQLIMPGQPPRTIVGVVGSVKNMGLAQQPGAQFYLPHLQALEGMSVTTPVEFLAIRTAVEPTSLAAAVRSRVAEVDPDVAVADLRPMNALLDDSVTGQRFLARLLTIFSALALALAAVGVYGVMSYFVTHRTREIAIRMALGAKRQDVVRLVVGQAMALALIGVAGGLAAAAGLTRFMESMLYGVSTVDPVVFVAVPALLSAVALLASVVPALRAARVDPLVALRAD